MEELRNLIGCQATVGIGKTRRGGTSGRGQPGGSWTYWWKDWEHWLRPPRRCNCCRSCYPKWGRKGGANTFLPSANLSGGQRASEPESMVLWGTEPSRGRAGSDLMQTVHDWFKVTVPRSWWVGSTKPSRNCWFLWYRTLRNIKGNTNVTNKVCVIARFQYQTHSSTRSKHMPKASVRIKNQGQMNYE